MMMLKLSFRSGSRTTCRPFTSEVVGRCDLRIRSSSTLIKLMARVSLLTVHFPLSSTSAETATSPREVEPVRAIKYAFRLFARNDSETSNMPKKLPDKRNTREKRPCGPPPKYFPRRQTHYRLIAPGGRDPTWDSQPRR